MNKGTSKSGMRVTIHKRRGKEKTGKKRGKDSISILLYTESEEKKRKIKTKKEDISLQEEVSHVW